MRAPWSWPCSRPPASMPSVITRRSTPARPCAWRVRVTTRFTPTLSSISMAVTWTWAERMKPLVALSRLRPTSSARSTTTRRTPLRSSALVIITPRTSSAARSSITRIAAPVNSSSARSARVPTASPAPAPTRVPAASPTPSPRPSRVRPSSKAAPCSSVMAPPSAPSSATLPSLPARPSRSIASTTSPSPTRSSAKATCSRLVWASSP